MQVEQIDLTGIKTLEQFYTLFEKYALLLAKEHDITDLLLKYKSQATDSIEIQKLQWEVEFFLYSFKGERVFAFSTSNGKSVGQVAEYPKLDAHQRDAFDHIVHRAQTAVAPILRARYNHLLWSSIAKKKQQFARDGATAYMECINECILRNNPPDNDWSYFIAQLFENLLGLVSRSKEHVGEVRLLANNLLFQQPALNFWAKHGIVEDMLSHPKLFKTEDFAGVLDIFSVHVEQPKTKTDDFSLANFHLPTAIKVAQKVKSDVKIWHQYIGEAYLRLADSETDESRNFIKLNLYRQTIDAFRLAGATGQKHLAEQRYNDLKPFVKLDEFRYDFDETTIKALQDYQEHLKEQARAMLKLPVANIYAILATKTLFPKYQSVLTAAGKKQPTFFDFGTVLQFDKNKNIFDQASMNDERAKILETYGNYMRDSLQPFLHYVFVFGIQSGRLTAKNFLRYLVEHTWIGKPHTKIDLGGHPITSNWVLQIAPAVAEFFSQVLAWGASKYYTPNFILCIDSLTLKMEGLFRNFCERVNIPSSVGKRNGVQEVLAHDIFDNKTVRKYFDEDDMLLFNYVFDREGGLNLRNNVAHCFYHEREYSSDYMLLLLAILLRLGKYDAKPIKADPPSEGE
ncbi:MAG TPA: DUF4209 domain-containing protein [Flavisolibacter sp.]|nr:DUF4209 domain-containing protein [Flavisolibacter sp.]